MADSSRTRNFPSSSSAVAGGGGGGRGPGNSLLTGATVVGFPFESFGTNAVLMPAISQNDSSVLSGELGEPDTFMGQQASPLPPVTSPPTPPASDPKPFTYFSQSVASAPDPFSQAPPVQPQPPPLNAATTLFQAPPSQPTPSTSPAIIPSMTFYNPPASSVSQPVAPPVGPPPVTTTPNSYRLGGQRPAYALAPGIAPVGMAPGQHDSGDVVPDSLTQLAHSSVYQPVKHHWFYCRMVEGKAVWKTFSRIDSNSLETAYRSGSVAVVPTDGGRYDVDLRRHVRTSVYWQSEEESVRRCSWFRKGPQDSRYMPYEEPTADTLEEEYRMATVANSWHRRVEFPNGEAVVMHSPTAIVHFQASGSTNEWAPEVRPHVVHRGTEEFSAEEGEHVQVDHLVFVVHGIGSVCDFKFRSVFEAVDDFRSLVSPLLQCHFASANIGRAEFLPVSWHRTLHGDDTGIDRKMGPITLRSIPKLRNFTNDTLLDILFYTSPVYCQTIMDTVGSEMNRMHRLFKERNPNFTGGVSLVGHSLGSMILFDMLLHQKGTDAPVTAPPAPHVSREGSPVPGSTAAGPVAQTVEELMEQLGLLDYMEGLEKEKVDMDTLRMCTDDDLKELGLPLGPRKKVLAALQEMKQPIINKSDGSENVKLPPVLERRVSAISVPKVVNYTMGLAGTGQPFITYPQLDFSPAAFFALGSPIAMFVTVRGIENLGEDFRLPTCRGVFNIFHPYDPVAYRMETLIDPNLLELRPVLIPHHKGRKRMHLELKETMQRVGADIKQRFLDSIWMTWNTVYQFARFHKTDPESIQQEVDKVLEEELQKRQQQEEAGNDSDSVASSAADQEIIAGQLNSGRRIDYVLQEAPLESFNEYLFAMSSHVCYWESEDTMLLILKEVYASMGVSPDPLPGSSQATPPMSRPSYSMSPTSSHGASVTSFPAHSLMTTPAQPPPPSSPPMPPFLAMDHPVAPSFQPPVSAPPFQAPVAAAVSYHPPVSMADPPPQYVGGRPTSAPSPQQALGMDPTAPPTSSSVGPPPMSGFVRQTRH